MNPVAGVAMFIMIWWTVLFAVLPFGTRPVAQPDAATGWRGAPEKPRMWQKALATTAISVVIWLACFWVITSPYLSFRAGWLALPTN